MGDKPSHPFRELIRARASSAGFDSGRSLSEEEVRELVEDSIQAPSSFNIQHWRFVAVRRPQDKEQLKEAAYGQSQVVDAAVTFIILGDIRGVEKLPAVLDQAVSQGALPEAKAAAWIRMAQEIYDDPVMARDEALRSGSLAAMVMMLAAEARGLTSAPLVGFDAAMVRERFDIDERYVPVMLLAVGYPTSRAAMRQPRMAVDDVLAFDRGRLF